MIVVVGGVVRDFTFTFPAVLCSWLWHGSIVKEAAAIVIQCHHHGLRNHDDDDYDDDDDDLLLSIHRAYQPCQIAKKRFVPPRRAWPRSV